jgi:hypothetical protein
LRSRAQTFLYLAEARRGVCVCYTETGFEERMARPERFELPAF